METSKKFVVSMLANDKAQKTTLFTSTGEIIELRHDGPYEINKLSEYLTTRLTGTEAVEIDLSDYTAPPTPFSLTDLADAGIVMVQVVNGKSVQGIFYPDVSAVEVQVGKDKVVIPHVENLQAHMARAAADGSPSVINFFKRLAPIIQSRAHSGEDLMKFIKKSEMPITNTGRIIAYKRVTSATARMISEHEHVTEENLGEFFVDTHSKQILQRVGSRVTMPVDMVDSSRHRSCSTGLHVANLGYLGGFSGDKTLIVLVDPENFIAVPHGEDTKARVCSYDIIGVMNAGQHNTVCKYSSTEKKHISGDVSFQDLIISAVEGETIIPFEEVMVGTKEVKTIGKISPAKVEKAPSKKPTSGKSLSDDPIIEAKEVRTENVAKVARKAKQDKDGIPTNITEAFDMLIAGKSKTIVAEHFNTSTRSIGRWMEKHDFDGYKSTEKSIPETQQEKDIEPMAKSTKPLTVAEQARKLFRMNHLAKLRDFKKAKKKSYSALGFTPAEETKIMANA